MKQRNWDRLQEGDTVTCKTSGVEYTLEWYTLEWLKRKGLDNRRQYKLTPATKARLRALDAPPADPAPASATLAVGDTVEVTGPTIARRINEIGRRGVITEHIPAGNSYQVDYAGRTGIFCGAFPASSLRRVQLAPDVVELAGKLERLKEDMGAAIIAADETPDVQPAATAYCPKCHHALGQADKHGCKCAAPAEQPDPAADLRREIRDVLSAPWWERMADADQASLLADTIHAAAAVPPADPPHIETLPGYAKGYNAGQSSILAPMLAALTQGGK